MHFCSSYMQHVVVLDANILFYKLLLYEFLKHMTYIQSLYGQHTINIQTIYGQHMTEIQLLVSRVEPWFPWRPSKVFAIQLPFYIVIKHVKN